MKLHFKAELLLIKNVIINSSLPQAMFYTSRCFDMSAHPSVASSLELLFECYFYYSQQRSREYTGTVQSEVKYEA